MAAVVKWLVLVYLMFVTAAPPVTELLETVVRLLNDCSRFYPNTNQMRRSHEEPGGFLLVFAALSFCACAQIA